MLQNFQISLDHQDLLEVGGKDSEKFLQGQLTCDLARLGEGQYGLGALCNNKGRVYANFRILRHDERFYLVMPQGIGATAKTQLAKYIPFYKAEMTNASSQFQRVGLAGPEARTWLGRQLPDLPAPGTMTSLGNSLLLNLGGEDGRFEYWTPAGQPSPVTSSAIPEANSPASWSALDMQSGLFFIEPEDIEAYTPEELNLDLAGFVSFSKGCYTGQEIVARMHYRGKACKRAFLAQGKAPQGLQQASTITLSDSSAKVLGKPSNLLFIDDLFYFYSVLKTPLLEVPLQLNCSNDIVLPITSLSLPAYSD